MTRLNDDIDDVYHTILIIKFFQEVIFNSRSLAFFFYRKLAILQMIKFHQFDATRETRNQRDAFNRILFTWLTKSLEPIGTLSESNFKQIFCNFAWKSKVKLLNIWSLDLDIHCAEPSSFIDLVASLMNGNFDCVYYVAEYRNFIFNRMPFCHHSTKMSTSKKPPPKKILF